MDSPTGIINSAEFIPWGTENGDLLVWENPLGNYILIGRLSGGTPPDVSTSAGGGQVTIGNIIRGRYRKWLIPERLWTVRK